jgi:hypothetical protein
MRLPRVRVTVRLMMVVVAVAALGLAIAEEFQDGLPPNFVVRGIPSRINRLRPGMSREETREILGVENSWLKGGTGAMLGGGVFSTHLAREVYNVRPSRLVFHLPRSGGGNPTPPKKHEPRAVIEVWFSTDISPGKADWRLDKSTRLVRATFSVDSGKIADVPGSK